MMVTHLSVVGFSTCALYCTVPFRPGLVRRVHTRGVELESNKGNDDGNKLEMRVERTLCRQRERHVDHDESSKDCFTNSRWCWLRRKE